MWITRKLREEVVGTLKNRTKNWIRPHLHDSADPLAWFVSNREHSQTSVLHCRIGSDHALFHALRHVLTSSMISCLLKFVSVLSTSAFFPNGRETYSAKL